MNKRIILISIGFLLLVVALCWSVQAAIFETFIEPTDDQYFSSTVLYENETTIQGYHAYSYRFSMEWDITVIPEQSTILNIALVYFGIDRDGVWIPLKDKVYVRSLDTQISTLGYSAADITTRHNDILTGSWYWDWHPNSFAPVMAVNSINSSVPLGSGTWYSDSKGNLSDNVIREFQENLSRGWWGITGMVNPGSGSPYVIIASTEHSTYKKPGLWIQYDLNAPVIENVTPVDGAENVNLTPGTCVNISHPSGTGMNISWYWYDGVDWYMYATEGQQGPTGWNKYIIITINHSQIEYDLYDFPLTLIINSTIAAECDGGKSLRFYALDNSTTYPYELRHGMEDYSWYDSRDKPVWVNISFISASTDTKIIMYYNNSDAWSGSDCTNVWNENFVGVYHMEDATCVCDSSNYNNHLGTITGDPTNATGIVGGAIEFDGNDAVRRGDTPDFNFYSNPASVSIWYNATAPWTAALSKMITRRGTAGQTNGWWITGYNATTCPYVYTLFRGGAADIINTVWGETLDEPNNWWNVYAMRIDEDNLNVTIPGVNGTHITADIGSMATTSSFSIGSNPDGTADFFTGIIDEVRITNGTCYNGSWHNATFNNTNDPDFLSMSGPLTPGIPVYNGTYCKTFGNATTPGTTYWWYVVVIDIYGNMTDEVFEFTTHCIDPPTNVHGTETSTTSINVTFTPKPDNAGTTHTLIYYDKGTCPPSWGYGTFGANTTNDFANITGLEEGQCYGFSLWTNWNGSWYRSSSRATLIFCLGGGYWNITLRYEDRNQELINLSEYPCSNHTLYIHYVGGAMDTYLFNNETYIANNNFSSFQIGAMAEVLFFEFHWNASYWSNCTCNRHCSYTRILLPAAAENISGNQTITFYLITDRNVYNDYYYVCPNLTYLEQDFANNLVTYTYSFDDRSGIFGSKTPPDSYATFYCSNTTNKLIIHQEYWSAVGKVNPTLLYGKKYYVGVGCSEAIYDYIGDAPTQKLIYEEIIIHLRTEESYLFVEIIDINGGWSDAATGLWVSYADSMFETIWVSCIITDTDGNIVYSKTILLDEYTFTWSAANHSRIYYINVTVYHNLLPRILSSNFPIYPGIAPFVQLAIIEGKMYNVFGLCFAYNPDTGETMPWTHLIFMLGGTLFIFLVVLTTGNIVMATMGAGIWMMGISMIISGFPTAFAIIGGFLIGLAVIISMRRPTR